MKKRSILAVQDDESLFDRIRSSSPDGCECILASDGAAAVDIARESKPDLVLVALAKDAYAGSGGTALSLCRSLRRLYQHEPLQLLLVAGSAEEAERVLARGYDAVLLLPAEDIEFRIAIRSAFQRLALQESVHEQREFFSGAVRREESLSSHLLDEYLAVKETLSAITAAKRSLETANRRLEAAASRDLLSGLLSRASLFERIRLEMRRADAEERVLSGILIDLDRFKSINDSYGHLAGDAVIREVGRRMTKHLRQGDHAGRYGGEEFFLLLPDTDASRAAATAERIRESFADVPFACGDELVQVTASFGVAEYRRGGGGPVAGGAAASSGAALALGAAFGATLGATLGAEPGPAGAAVSAAASAGGFREGFAAKDSGDGLIERADQAMYRAKQLGRNRVCVDGRD